LRWALRAVAVGALVVVGFLVVLHPIATVQGFPADLHFACTTPLERIRYYVANGGPFPLAGYPPFDGPAPAVVVVVCLRATSARVHLVDLLGAGALLILGLSFLPHRRRQSALIPAIPITPS
jgi:hypothetical protein